jgi:TctA family transporter
MAAQAFGNDHTWFDGRAARRVSDIALGATLVAVAALTIANVPDNPLRAWPRLDAWFFPASVAALLVVAGLVLILRGSFFGHRQSQRWVLGALIVVSALVLVALTIQAAVIAGLAAPIALLLGPEVFAALLSAQRRINQSTLLFGRLGPPELVTLIVLTLAAAIALARQSHVRAAGMVLLGLLLSSVGEDVATGTLRLTMGLDRLKDGVPFLPAALGLIVVADCAICLASPTVLLQSYARQVAGWTGLRLSTGAATGLRIAAALLIAAACTLAFTFAYSSFDIGVLITFAAFGISCKLLGWNRLVLMLAMFYGPELAEHFRLSILLSNGDPAILARWPLSATFLLLTCAVLVGLALLSLRRRLLLGRSTA